jgi:hypothetical protein
MTRQAGINRPLVIHGQATLTLTEGELAPLAQEHHQELEQVHEVEVKAGGHLLEPPIHRSQNCAPASPRLAVVRGPTFRNRFSRAGKDAGPAAE